MNGEQLIEYFEKGFEEFSKYQWNDNELMLKRAAAKHEVYVAFMKQFHHIYTNTVIFDLESFVLQTLIEIDRELSFYFEPKMIEDKIFRRIEGLAPKYLNNSFYFLNILDDFDKSFFNPENYKTLGWMLFTAHQEEFIEWFASNGTRIEIEEILEKEISSLNQLMGILIENNLLKDKLQKARSENFQTKSSPSQLSRNQVILLLDEIGFIPFIEENSLTVQAEIISKITGFNNKNIKSSLENLGKKEKSLTKQHQRDKIKVDETIKETGLDLPRFK